VKMYDKGQDYFPRITPILKKYNLPEELKVLIALESGFNANAVSRAGAVGYWQMMNESAKDYGLKTNTAKKDERKNLIKSTTAASKYLVAHAKMLGDNLLLMVASYNCGIGKIKQAIKRAGITNAGFWDIKKYLPKETRNYVMDFIALNIIFANYDKFSKRNLVFTPVVREVPVDNANKLNTSLPVN
jgi:membrane-bound lytic murein transglycosylase D